VHYFFFSPLLLKSFSFLRQKITQGTQAAKSGFVGLVVFAVVLSLLPPSSICIPIPDFKCKAIHNGMNAQKPKATHQKAPTAILKNSLYCSQGLMCSLLTPKPTQKDKAEEM
jgi:hypothetical protein